MEKYLNHNIIFEINQYLGRNDTLNFLSICKKTDQSKHLFFEKYVVKFKKYDINDLLESNSVELNVYKNYLKKLVNIGEVDDTEFLKYMPNVKQIIFSNDFDQTVNNLPASVKHLSFSSEFKQSIDNLPSDLISLSLECGCNCEFDNLPKNLINFSVCEASFIKKFRFPKTIEVLRFTYSYCQWPYGAYNFTPFPNLKELFITETIYYHYKEIISDYEHVKVHVEDDDRLSDSASERELTFFE